MHEVINRLSFATHADLVALEFELGQNRDRSDLIPASVRLYLHYCQRAETNDSVSFGNLCDFVYTLETGGKGKLSSVDGSFEIEAWMQHEFMMMQGVIVNPFAGGVERVMNSDYNRFFYEFRFSFAYDKKLSLEALEALGNAIQLSKAH